MLARGHHRLHRFSERERERGVKTYKVGRSEQNNIVTSLDLDGVSEVE